MVIFTAFLEVPKYTSQSWNHRKAREELGLTPSLKTSGSNAK